MNSRTPRSKRENRKRDRSPERDDPFQLRVGAESSFEGSATRDDPDERGPLVVPLWWVNSVIAVFLLPLAAVWTRTFFHIFSTETVRHGYWVTDECWFFCLGAVLWLLAFFGPPPPVVVYVFGHELTHAVWVWLMGGRVSDFKFGVAGGYILTNKQNVWISLAPYFYPIYSVMVIILYAIAALFWDMAPYTCWLFMALGFTWCFHLSFTVWMIPKGQTDLTYYGTFFSLVIIYLMNLAVLTGLLLLTAPHATLWSFAREFLHNAAHLIDWAVEQVKVLSS